MMQLSQFLVFAALVAFSSVVSIASAGEALPELPAALKSVVVSPRSHPGEVGAQLGMKRGLLEIRLNAASPLTPEQWDAVASLRPKVFHFNDQALRDEDMDRLVALDPVEISLRITPLTGKGALKFGEMAHLKSLETHHMHTATPEAEEALTHHPALEVFRTAGAFGIEALRGKRLRSVELAEKAANRSTVEVLAENPQIEVLSLFAHNILTVDDACLSSVAKIKTLHALRLSFVELTFEGSLKPLLDLPSLSELTLYQVEVPAADLERFQSLRPSVKVRHTPMDSEYRSKLEPMRAKERSSKGLQTQHLRVELSASDGALVVEDLRTKHVWRQVRVEKEELLKQRILQVDPLRREMLLECGLAGVRADGKRGVASARVMLRVPEGKSDLELTWELDAKEEWRQVAYPYVFARDGETVSNLFPHGEGMLVPVRKRHPDWLALPDGDLYGGVHSYLMCVGLVEEASGEGLLTWLPDVEATLLKWCNVQMENEVVVAPQFLCRSNKGRFDRPWRMTFSFSHQGSYVALAQRYRDFFAAQGLHKTLRQKAAENPAVHEILGAPVLWANTQTPKLAADMAQSFREAGVERCLFAMCNVPLHRPEVPDWEPQMAQAIERIRAVGYHAYRYDQYRDAFEPDPTQSHHFQLNTKAWPEMLVKRPDGTRVAAFGPKSGIVCAKFFMPLAVEQFDREFSQFAYSARFLDCLGSVGFNAEAECFDPGHPCDRYFTRQQRVELLAELNRRGKLAATECGIDYLIPYVHWFEGASTLVRWQEFFAAKERVENSGINDSTGANPSQRMAALGKLSPTERAEQTVSMSPRYRIPFYSLCHHDEVVVTWRWEDGMDEPPVYWQWKNLWSVLSGTPPMYRTTAGRIAKYREQIHRTQRYVSDWVREVAFDAMLDHRFLTADRTVQESVFSSGQGVVVNFGERDYELSGGVTVKAREYVKFHQTAQGGRTYQAPVCRNVFAEETVNPK